MLLSRDRYKRGKNMDRKKIKKQAKMLMKKHFGFLVAICLVSAMITSEFGGTLSWIFSQNNEAINEEMTALPSDLSTSKVLQDIFDDNLDAGEKMADEIKQKEISSVKNPAFGRSRGVFAALINSITSGSIFFVYGGCSQFNGRFRKFGCFTIDSIRLVCFFNVLVLCSKYICCRAKKNVFGI